MNVRSIEWKGDHLALLDQRLLPGQELWLELRTWRQVADAIVTMAVRGAPAIGIAAAYGYVLAAFSGDDLDLAREGLAKTRPTAVNLFWALDRLAALGPDPEILLREARAMELEDLQMNLGIGYHGATLVPHAGTILTICNTGALATGGHGTALGIIRTCVHEGNPIQVFACETRPRLQGLRLTAYELLKEEIPFHMIADGAAAFLMATRQVDCVIVGADRIAANGDTANKIGTYGLAVAAKYHEIPFYVAAPSSSIDAALGSGKDIPIEERSPDEIHVIEGNRISPEGTPAWNPAFDVTPASLIQAIVTENGVFRPPFDFRS